MRGRRPAGPSYVENLDGDAETKQRLKVILQTMAGELGVLDACKILKVCTQRFHQLREEAMRGALGALAPRPRGRPPQMTTLEQEQLDEVENKLAQAEVELRAARAREELALVLPRVLKETPLAAATTEKKTRRGRRK